MNTATAAIADNKLTPVASVVSKPVVFTAQYLSAQAVEFESANLTGGYSARDILATTVRFALNDEIQGVSLACSGMIEGSRGKDAQGKPVDGKKTPARRKYASWLKSVYGAVRFAGMSVQELDGYASADAMYAASVVYRKEAGGIDWKGTDEATKEAGKVKKATKAAVEEAAEESGVDTADILTMQPEALAALQAAAKVKLAESAAKAKLASMEKDASKLVKSLCKEYGLDDAETVLKRALEMIALGQV